MLSIPFSLQLAQILCENNLTWWALHTTPPLRLLKHVSKSKVPLHESSHTVIHTYKLKWIYFFEMRIFLLENILNRLRRSAFMKQNWKGESGQHDNQLDSVKIRNTAGHLYCSGCLQKSIQSLKIYFRYFLCWIQAGPTMSHAHVEACIHVDAVHICLTWFNAHNWIKLHIRKLSISEIHQYIKTCTILSIKLHMWNDSDCFA